MKKAQKEKLMKKKLAVFALMLSMFGCENDPVKTIQTNNVEVPVHLLFEHDGCAVYRFYDDGRDHYYAVCKSGSASTSNTIQEGKTETTEEISTVKR